MPGSFLQPKGPFRWFPFDQGLRQLDFRHGDQWTLLSRTHFGLAERRAPPRR